MANNPVVNMFKVKELRSKLFFTLLVLAVLRFDIGFDSKVGNLNFVSLEAVYNKMITIKNKTNSQTFEEHTEKLMEIQGFRM